jgi:hypothetical protein
MGVALGKITYREKPSSDYKPASLLKSVCIPVRSPKRQAINEPLSFQSTK